MLRSVQCALCEAFMQAQLACHGADMGHGFVDMPTATARSAEQILLTKVLAVEQQSGAASPRVGAFPQVGALDSL